MQIDITHALDSTRPGHENSNCINFQFQEEPFMAHRTKYRIGVVVLCLNLAEWIKCVWSWKMSFIENDAEDN